MLWQVYMGWSSIEPEPWGEVENRLRRPNRPPPRRKPLPGFEELNIFQAMTQKDRSGILFDLFERLAARPTQGLGQIEQPPTHPWINDFVISAHQLQGFAAHQIFLIELRRRAFR